MDTQLLSRKIIGNGRRFLLVALASVFAALWLTPILALFFAATKSPDEFLRSAAYLPWKEFKFFENLKTVFQQYRLGRHLLSSFAYASIGGIITIMFSTASAYSIVRLKPRGSFLLFMIIYSGTLFPFQMYLIPLYNFYNQVGLYNSFTGLLLIYIAITIPFAVFVFRGFYHTIPHEHEDSAKIDGCNSFQAFLFVFLPQSGAATAVVALFQMTWIWNDLLFGMVLSRSEHVRPLMVALASMSGYGGGTIPYIMTAVLIASIPTILLYFALMHYFVAGLSQQAGLK